MILVVEEIHVGPTSDKRTMVRLVLDHDEDLPRVYEVREMLSAAIENLPRDADQFNMKRLPKTKGEKE